MRPQAMFLVFIVSGSLLYTIWGYNKWLRIIAGLIGISALVYIWLIGSIKIGQRFHVQDKTGKFQFALVPTKGRDINMMHSSLAVYKEKNEIEGDLELYRTMKMNYLDPSMWLDYSFNPYWKFEYIEKE